MAKKINQMTRTETNDLINALIDKGEMRRVYGVAVGTSRYHQHLVDRINALSFEFIAKLRRA